MHLDPPGPEPVGLGRFGEFGGRFVPETLVPALIDLEEEFRAAWGSDEFRAEFAELLRSYAGRPTPVTECHRLSERLGLRVLLKREDLTHTGSHKINNVLGQALLTRRMGKQRVIAETGAGQHGVATATAAALFGLDCIVFMGAVDVERQALNVFRMKLLGAEVVPVTGGARRSRTRSTRPCATGSRPSSRRTTASARWWVRTRTRGWCASSSGSWATKPGSSAVRSSAATTPTSSSPAWAEARTRWVPSPASSTRGAELVGVEAGGLGLESGRHGASVSRGTPGVLHGARSLFLQDEDGQIIEAHSISAGLDYPGVGPEHAAARGRPVAPSTTSPPTTRRSRVSSSCR